MKKKNSRTLDTNTLLPEGDIIDVTSDTVDLPVFADKQEYVPANGDFHGPNLLIEAKYKMTLNGNKLLDLALSKGDQAVHEGKQLVVKIAATEIKEIFGTEGNSIYDALDSTARQLVGTLIGISDPEKEYFHYISIITEAEYKDGFVTIGFNEKLGSYLFDLKKNYTLLNIKTIGKFRHNAALRLYTLLRRYAYPSEHHFTQQMLDGGYEIELSVAELKFELGIANGNEEKLNKWLRRKDPDYDTALENASEQKYRDWDNFRRSVILPAIEEINRQTELYVDFNPIRVGRAIKRIRFLVHYKQAEIDKNNAPLPILEQPAAEWSDELIAAVASIVETEPPIARRDAITLLDAARGDISRIESAYNAACAYNGTITNLIGFLLNAIEKGYNVNTNYRLKSRQHKPEGMSAATYDSIHDFPEHDYDMQQIELNMRNKGPRKPGTPNA